MRARTFCILLLCCGPLLTHLGYNAAIWLRSSEAERFLRWGSDPDELDPRVRCSVMPATMQQATCSPDKEVRRAVYRWVYWLFEEGTMSCDASARLLARGLRDPDLDVRLRAMETTVAAGAFDSAPGPAGAAAWASAQEGRSLRLRLGFHLAAATADCHWKIREMAIYALGHLGKDGRFALPEIEQALRDPNPAVATAAEWAVREFEQESGSPGEGAS